MARLIALDSAWISSARFSGSVRTRLVPFLTETTLLELGVASTTAAATTFKRVKPFKRRRLLRLEMGIEPRVHERHGCVATLAIENGNCLFDYGYDSSTVE